MTARPSARSEEKSGLRVLRGRKLRKPTVAPWMVMAMLAVVAFLGLGFARTSLDRTAFELAELNRAIDQQAALNRQLDLEIARLENPARIAPLAEELGLVIPSNTRQILVDLGEPGPVVAGTPADDSNQ